MGLKARISEVRALCSDGLLWMRIWKTVPVLAWMKAAEAYRTGNFGNAVEYYRKGLSKYSSHPAHFSARFDLAYCLERLGHYDEAIQELNYLIKLRCDLPEAYLSQVKLLSYMGKYSNAFETIEIAKAVFPDNLEILIRYFDLLMELDIQLDEIKSTKSKIDELNKAIIRTTDDNYRDVIYTQKIKSEALVSLAHYEYFYGDEIKSDQMLSQILTSGVVSKRAYLLKGQKLLNNSRIIQARELFRKAFAVDPLDPIPQMLIAETYATSTDQDEIKWAVQLAESACKSSKWNNPEVIETLIKVYQLNSELVKAELFSARLKEIGEYKIGTQNIKTQAVSFSK